MRKLILSASLLAVAGCSGGNPVSNTFSADAKAERRMAKQAAADNRALKAGFAPEQPGGLEMPRIDPVAVSAPGAALPPSADQYRYIGRWAASPDLCARHAWRFQTRSLATDGATSCTLPTVAAVPGGYELQGSCKARGTATEQTLKLSFDERRRTMRVAGKSLGPITLIYCGA